MGYADPAVRIGYGYVTNRMGIRLEGDPRDFAIRAAIPERARSAIAETASLGFMNPSESFTGVRKHSS